MPASVTQMSKHEKLIKVLKEAQTGNFHLLQTTKEAHIDFHWCELRYDKTGDTVLHVAARFGHILLIKYLLTEFSPCLVNFKNIDDKTALHEAAQFAQLESCKILLEFGAEVNVLKRADWTPLMLACTKIKPALSHNTVELLLKNGSLVNYTNKDGWTALHLVCREGSLEILELLAKYDVDLNLKTKNGRTALHIASLHGHCNVVKCLTNFGLNVNEKDSCGNTPLHESILGQHIDISKLLIENGADICCHNNMHFGLLHLAASEGNIDVVQYLIKELNFDVNEKNSNGYTPLHCAARNKQRLSYDTLIKFGASELCKDNFNRTSRQYLNL